MTVRKTRTVTAFVNGMILSSQTSSLPDVRRGAVAPSAEQLPLFLCEGFERASVSEPARKPPNSPYKIFKLLPRCYLPVNNDVGNSAFVRNDP